LRYEVRLAAARRTAHDAGKGVFKRKRLLMLLLLLLMLD